MPTSHSRVRGVHVQWAVMADKRKVVLLKACYDMLRKCDSSHYVQNVMEETVYYDGADCDGRCLMEDIATELGLTGRER